ncbi:MAG TPA: hypothetical protein VHS97_00215 [Isosphaeraceae bacterium]|nr:hypothetical protein [Isosphaeraceae bacterium]
MTRRRRAQDRRFAATGLPLIAGVFDLKISIDLSMDALSAGSFLLSPEL